MFFRCQVNDISLKLNVNMGARNDVQYFGCMKLCRRELLDSDTSGFFPDLRYLANRKSVN